MKLANFKCRETHFSWQNQQQNLSWVYDFILVDKNRDYQANLYWRPIVLDKNFFVLKFKMESSTDLT